MTEMNVSALTRFKDLIDARIAELTNDLARGKSGEAVVTLDQQSVGRLSRMDALQSQAMAKAQSARRDSELARLKNALKRIADGEYGYCEDCGDLIPEGRLMLDLAAQRCVSCISG